MTHTHKLEGPIDFGKVEYDPLPLDFLLLDTLPDEGTIGGIHWRGRRVIDVRNEVNEKIDPEAAITSNEVMARFRSMHVAGLVKPFQGRKNGAKIWARTPKGVLFLEHKEAYLGNHG